MSFDRGVGWTGPRGWEVISLKSTGKLDPLKNFVSMSNFHFDVSNFRVTPTCCSLIFPSFLDFSPFFPDLRLISFNPLDRYYMNITANNLQSKFLLILYFALRVTIYIISFFLFYVDIIERVESNNCHFLYDDNIPIIISGITDISDVFSKILERITRKEKHLMRLIDLESDLVQSMPNF